MLTHGWNLSLFTAALNKNWDNQRASFYGDPVAALDSDIKEEERRLFKEFQKKKKNLLIIYLHGKSQGVNTESYRVKKATRTKEGDWLIYFFNLEIRKLK